MELIRELWMTHSFDIISLIVTIVLALLSRLVYKYLRFKFEEAQLESIKNWLVGIILKAEKESPSGKEKMAMVETEMLRLPEKKQSLIKKTAGSLVNFAEVVFQEVVQPNLTSKKILDGLKRIIK